MKVLIWILVFFVGTLTNSFIGPLIGIRFGYLVLDAICVPIAIKLCKIWDEKHPHKYECGVCGKHKFNKDGSCKNCGYYSKVECKSSHKDVRDYRCGKCGHYGPYVGKCPKCGSNKKEYYDSTLFLKQNEEVNEKDPSVKNGVTHNVQDANDALLSPVFCRKCGAKLIKDADFCDKCGEKIEEIK